MKTERRDFHIYNEACAIYAASESLAGRDPEEVFALAENGGREGVLRALAEGVFLPLELLQDDSFNARVVLGELNGPEAEEWVVRAAGKLAIPDGRLGVGGGWAVIERLVEDPEDGYWKDFVRFVDVPAGDYLVEAFGYLPGTALYPFRQMAQDGEPLGSWFRRTRPGQEFPAWLQSWTIDEAETMDPGHEAEWEALAKKLGKEGWKRLWDERGNGFVEYVFRLEPWSGQLSGEPKLCEAGETLAWEVRKPERCPLGVRFEGPRASSSSDGD
jgi:hypothetical protein